MRTVGVKLVADVSQYMTNMKRAGLATKDLASGLDQTAKSGKLDKVANTAALAGIALGGIAVAAVKMSADFDKQMSSVAAATHAGAAEIGQLRAAALQAGKDTQFSATQAAQGIEELSKAGVSTASILGGGLKGALDLAAAGQLDVGEAAETAATAMTQFGLSGGQVPHVADLLAAAAGKAQGSVHDMGFALKQSGLVASRFGLSVEDTTGTLAAFASAGLIGSDAGTSFKTMLLQLANPADKTKELMKQLGINAYDASGAFVGITNLAGQLQTKLGGLTQAQRDAALAQIFGTDAIRAANVLYKQGTAGIQGWIDKTNDAGYAAETARIKTDNLAGDIERLKGSLETLAIESGSGANSGLRVFTKSLNELVDQFGRMPSAVGSTVTVIAGIGGVALLGLAAFIKLRKGMAEAVAQLNAMGPAGEKAAVGLQKTASMAAKAAAAFAVLEIAATVFNSLDEKSANVDRLTASLTNLANTGNSAGEINKAFGDNFDNLGKIAGFAESAEHGYGHFVDSVASKIPIIGDAGKAIGNFGSRLIAGTDFDTAKQQMAGLDTALVNFMNTTNDARKSSDLWNQILLKSGLSTEQLAQLLPDAYKKLGELNTAADKGGTALGNMSGAAAGAKAGVKGVGGAAAKSAEDIKKMIDAEKELFGAQMSLDRADIAVRNGMVDLSKELKSGARSLSLNSAEGRKNRSAVLDQLSAIDDLRQARIRHGWTLDQAQGKYNKDIGGLRRSMLQAGFSKKAVDQLLGSYKALPSKVDTKVSVSGDSAAMVKLRALNIMQNALRKGVSISTSAARALAGDVKAAKDRGVFAAGGWTGPGSKYEPAGIVHADEFVIRKESRQRIERQAPGALDRMNMTGRLPGYARGGEVTWPFPVTAAMTRIPSKDEAMAVVGPPGGQTYKWIEAAVRAAFPGMAVLSDFRPGARTLSGNVSYHALGRAVDFPPSRPLAEWINAKYFARTKELITPYNDLNIWNGQRHRYTGAVWNQHNFAGGNAHDHWAMAGGGVIREPVFGVGASGDTYSLGEGYRPETVTPGVGGGNTYQITVNPTPLAHPRDIGREIIWAIHQYEGGSGSDWRR